jgi:hypothetical protein
MITFFTALENKIYLNQRLVILSKIFRRQHERTRLARNLTVAEEETT